MQQEKKYILNALGFVWESSKNWTILLLITQVVQAILPLGILYLTKLIVDLIPTLKESGDFRTIGYYILIFGLIHLCLALIQNYQELIKDTQQQLVSDHMSSVIIKKAISLDMSYYENSAYYNTFHQAQRQALFRPVQILQSLSTFTTSLFLLASLAGLLIFLHWGIALVLICFGLPIAAVRWHYSRKLFEWEKNRTFLERESGYLNQVLTTDTYAKEVRIFNIGHFLLEKFSEVRKKLFKEKYRITSQRAKAGFFAKGAEILAMTISFGFIVYLTFLDRITIGDLVMYFAAFQKGQVAIQQSLTSLVGLYNNRLFLSHLFDLMNVKSLIKDVGERQKLPTLIDSIRFENVDFVYPNTEKLVLQNVDIQFKKGESVALVGENGSGKTTLVKLLCRLYDPIGGSIVWDDVDFKNASLEDLRNQISVIYQDFSKYHFSVEKNISIGNLNVKAEQEKIKSAAKKSGADSFIEQFPEQYHQRLGRWFKNGVELSGGQWQKIALSRAFYKNSEIIILDEPSSAIDPLAEAEIFKNFMSLAKEKVLILVTHRLYNLQNVDKIIVLHEGKIVEVGNHSELITLNGRYKKMFEKQVNIGTGVS